MQRTQKFTDTVKDVVQSMGYIYWGIEYSGFGLRAKLCVFIDSKKGISLDDCASVSEQLSSILDIENVIDGAYTLEVSSPGLERPLFEINQYREYLGYEVKVMTYKVFEGRKNFVGKLDGVEEDAIALDVDNNIRIEIPFDLIRKAKLVYRPDREHN